MIQKAFGGVVTQPDLSHQLLLSHGEIINYQYQFDFKLTVEQT